MAWHHRRTRQPRVKVAKPAKIPRPKVRDLRLVLKGLISVSVQSRIAALAYALQWYDTALPYLVQKGKLPPDGKKKLENAVKCRKQGMGTIHDEEKETAFLMAVRLYEKACVALKPVAVDKFFDLFKKKKVTLEKKQNKLELKFGGILEMLQKAIGNRVRLQVADAPKAVQYDPALTSLSYNRDAVKQMAQQYRAEGLLAVFVDQLETLSMHAALKPDGNGGWAYDPAEQVQVQDELLHSFITFAKSSDAPKRLVKGGAFIQKQPKAPCAQCNGTGILADGAPCAVCIKAPRPVRTMTKGPRILGFLIPGTAIATVYERLKDEQHHDLQTVIAGLTTGDPVGRVKQLQRYGQQKGLYDVTITGNSVQLVHKPGVAP